MRRGATFTRSLLAVAIAAAAACGGGGDDGGSPTTPPPGIDPGDLTPVIGSWTADSIVVSPKANPAVSREIVSADGVVFTFVVESSGAYRATLNAFGQSSQETGTLRVSGDRLFFTVQSPLPGSSSGTFSRQGELLVMLGDLVLDFNQDGTPDDLSTRFVLRR